MLIYSSQKEFLGIDEKDLQVFGFSKLSDLLKEVSDFADLFVKTPGFIHNFKHVHWIDFIACAESSEDAQAIINVNNKSFKCKLSVENFFLSKDPSSKSYLIFLNNLRELNRHESEDISLDEMARPTPLVETFISPDEEVLEIEPLKEDPYETPLEVDFELDDEDLSSDEYLQDDYDEVDGLDEIDDASFDVQELTQESAQAKQNEFVAQSAHSDYVYDPKVASDELGLPLDLIEEFIQDFIAQAKEFKEDIYTALDEAEFDQVKILSHKLKGVAANLRIEDAFEALSVVNTSGESNVIREHLDSFYKIIAKLAGEEVGLEEELTLDMKEETKEFEPNATSVEEDDDLYENLLDISDSQVPQKIDIVELADDEFLSSDIDIESIDDEIDKIENIELLELDKELETYGEDSLEEEMTLDFADEISDEDAVVQNEIKYSKERAASEIGVDIESFNELFEDYIGESGIILMQMRDALEKNDYKTCKHEVLKLHGMSENMRVDGLTQEFETITHSEDKEQLFKAVESLEKKISQLLKVGA